MSITPRLLTRTLASSSSRLIRAPVCHVLQGVAGPSRLPANPRSYPNGYRRYATTVSATTSSTPDLPPIPSNPGIKVTPPSIEAIKEEGFFEDDVVLVPEEEARLVITPQAVQVSFTSPPLGQPSRLAMETDEQQLVSITSKEPPDVISAGKLALRVGVESGGCHGYQYTMALTEERGVDD
jgi:hypothetical protein